MNLLLKNLRWLAVPARRSAARRSAARRGDLRLRRGRIAAIGQGLVPGRRERTLNLAGYLAFPGLINGHDHLSLNLLPHLGDPPYPSMYRFAEDVYRPHRSPIREHLQVAVRDRLWWGAYKNLVSGVTTVVHHDPFTRRVFHRAFPVKVLRRYGWSHSLGYPDNPPSAHAARPGAPYLIHAAEGVDEASYRELDRLDELGLLGPRTVLVHAVALTPRQRSRLQAAGASVVWCPASNLRLYDQTAAIDELLGRVRLAVGTDSTLSGSPTLLDEMRLAAGTGLATAGEILDMATVGGAAVFGLGDGRGQIAEGAPADLFFIPDPEREVAATLLRASCAEVALVLLDGRPRLAQPAWAEALGLGPPNARVAGRARWLYGDLGRLKARIARAAAPWRPLDNPLWSLLEPLVDHGEGAVD